MRVVTYQRGVSTLLIPMEELRPVNAPPISDAFARIQARYSFGWTPDLTRPYEDVVQGPHVFSGGKLERGGRHIAINKLQLFNDGIVVTAQDTDASDAVLEDLIEWGTRTFGYRTPTTQPTRLFSSALVVDMDFDIDVLLNPLGKKLSKLFSDHLGAGRPQLPFWKLGTIRIAGISTPQDLPDSATHFVLERRATMPFDKLRYFSDGPISTNAHIAFLEELEKLAASAA